MIKKSNNHDHHNETMSSLWERGVVGGSDAALGPLPLTLSMS